jgi:hypothetical protein
MIIDAASLQILMDHSGVVRPRCLSAVALFAILPTSLAVFV